jgi:hypothetical protein
MERDNRIARQTLLPSEPLARLVREPVQTVSGPDPRHAHRVDCDRPDVPAHRVADPGQRGDRAARQPIEPALGADPDIALAILEQRPHHVAGQRALPFIELDDGLAGLRRHVNQAFPKRRNPQIAIRVVHQTPRSG